MSQNPTENLRRGRRRIEEIAEIILLKDWTWDVVTKRFYLHIRVCLDHDGKDIPRVTEWFVTAETVYPFGTIAIYPSCKNSITNTFPSALYLKTMVNLSKDEDLGCPEPILLVIGGSSSNWLQYIGVYVKEQEIELYEINNN